LPPPSMVMVIEVDEVETLTGPGKLQG